MEKKIHLAIIKSHKTFKEDIFNDRLKTNIHKNKIGKNEFGKQCVCVCERERENKKLLKSLKCKF